MPHRPGHDPTDDQLEELARLRDRLRAGLFASQGHFSGHFNEDTRRLLAQADSILQANQAEQETPPPPRTQQEQEEEQIDQLREDVGFRVQQPSQAPAEQMISEEIEQQQRPVFEGFFGDVKSLVVGTAQDIADALAFPQEDPGAEQARQAANRDIRAALSTQEERTADFLNTEQAATERIQENTNPSIFDLGANVLTQTSAGLVGGARFGIKNLPVVGEYADVALAPMQADMDVAAANTAQQNAQAMDSAFGSTLFTAMPGFASRLGGALTGGYATLKPWMFVGNLLLSGPRALRTAGSFNEALQNIGQLGRGLQSGFIGDIAGISLFGAATGERGILSATLEGPVEGQFGERLFEMTVDPKDPWWKQTLAQTVNRAEAAAAMGADGFAMGILFATGAHGMLRMKRYADAQMASIRTKLLGSESTVSPEQIVAMRQAQFFRDPGRRKLPVIRNSEESRLVTQLRASEELIAQSPSAQRLLVEQQAVEGVTSYQSNLAALVKAVDELHVSDEATHGVLRGIEDPFRLFDDVRSAGPISERVQNLPVVQRGEPMVHSVDEIPEEAVFGYTEGLSRDPVTEVVRTTQRDAPLFLKNKPNPPAVERGVVEEVVVNPGKTWEFNNYNEILEQHGSIDEMIRKARSNNVEMVNVLNTGARGGQQHIVLEPEAIRSTKPITPEQAGVAAGEDADAATVLRSMASEPIEVSLKRRLPEMRFETPVKRDDGTYDLIFSKEGAPGLSNEQLRQFKETGFFRGQRVQYAGKTYEVVRRRGEGGRGSTIELKDPLSGETVTPAVRNVFELPSARVQTEVDDALFRDFAKFFEDNLQRLGDRQPDREALRDMAMAADDPAVLNRDFADDALDAMIYPQEVMAPIDVAESLARRAQQIDDELRAIGDDFAQAERIQSLVDERLQIQRQIQDAAKQAQAEGRISSEINLDEAFVDFPDQLDYGTILFNRWARTRDIDMTPGEAQALKHSFFRKLNRDAFRRLPENVRQQYTDLQQELVSAWENLPETTENLAKMAGFELVRMKQGTLALRRPGKVELEGLFSNEQALQAALKSNLRHGSVPNLTPQINWLEGALPSGPGLGATPGSTPDDMFYLTADDALPFVNRTKEFNKEGLKSKPKFILPFEDKTGIPLWTEYLNPLFNAKRQANTKSLPFMERWISQFKGMSRDERTAIADFVRSVESHSEFLDPDALRSAAVDFGLNERQISAVEGMRGIMDELFQVGTQWYGFGPQDYIFQYFTRLKPRIEGMKKAQISRSPDRMFSDVLPPEYDRFVSKYHREGMLPQVEDDPLVVGMKYIRTFFHERFVKGPFDRLRNFIDIKLGDLPPEQANTILDNMSPTVRKQLERQFNGNVMNAPALPREVRGPLHETLNYMQGYPKEASGLATDIFDGLMKGMGIKVDKSGIETVVNSLMMELYGSTLGFRPKPVVRNMYQTVANMLGRLKASNIDEGFRRARLPESFERGVDEGWIDLKARGLPFGEEMTVRAINEIPVQRADNMMGDLVGGVTGGLLKSLILDGKIARFWQQFANKGLSGITRTDWFQRVWTAEAQTAETLPWLRKFLNGDIGAARLKKKGLRYWESSIQNKFVRLAEDQGEDAAMAFIREQAADIANYNYSKSSQATALQSPEGRFAFQFGTWPIWRKDLFLRSMKNARTMEERVSFLAKESIATGALALFGLQNGIDMKSWMSHESILTYSGGPIVSSMVDLYRVLNAEVGQKWDATKRLVRNNVLRLIPPGRIFWEDLTESIELSMDNPQRGFMQMFFGRPVDDGLDSWSSRMLRMIQQSKEEEQGPSGQPLPEIPQPQIERVPRAQPEASQAPQP